MLALVAGLAVIPMSGCSDILDKATNVIVLQEENAELEAENDELKAELEALKIELATLKFNTTFPGGIVNESIIINNIIREVGNTEGDAIQVTDSAIVTINGGIFDGGQTPFGSAGNTALWCNGVDAKVIINNGVFKIGGLADGDTGHIELIYCKYGTVEINDGYFEGADDTVWLLNCNDASYKAGTANIIVKGGTFKNFNPADCVSEGEHTNFVAPGYSSIGIIYNAGTAEEYTLYTIIKD